MGKTAVHEIAKHLAVQLGKLMDRDVLMFHLVDVAFNPPDVYKVCRRECEQCSTCCIASVCTV